MQNDYEELFRQAKELIKDELSSIAYDTWILPLKLISIDDDRITIKSNTDYNANFLGKRFGDLIINTFKYLTNKERSLTIIYNDEKTNMEMKDDVIPTDSENEELESEIELSNKILNPKYTFDTFVVGNNNRFAQAAALAVADKPSEAYNPLFLYGGVGLGKTHLMHAIGNRILKNYRNYKILYVTSEKFTNHMINAIKDNKMEVFRNQYRKIDVLLIDDIQFIAGKKQVQEEFFHTFNELYEEKKQIIISSDRPPKEIQLLEDRLKSRFEWGLLADISCPDYETRLAILRRKAQDEKILVDDSILASIATKIESNIRELEGVFNKMIARASLMHTQISIELAENTINEFKAENEKVLSSDYVKDIVAKYFSVDKNDLSSNKRSNEIAFPRQIAMYLCREVANMSYPKIGEDFGNRDHSTVMHACKKIENEIKEKNNTRLIVESVKNIIINGEQKKNICLIDF